ncbi:hypothetical protein [Aquimarina sp. RZ0]|uniref:hypothetical protein n=1 Tax=Aquimarina sp. RZ0 TaxID=2607730 RepID=UPI0011F24246|nr:hypothetical protein [Aquimarina sp. RZ0]KAA1246949.1 hypothetical protein F0000_05670 [Aquimarina sp. RZ0]
MAKALIACFRKEKMGNPTKYAEGISFRLSPDNATITEPYLHYDMHALSIVYNPTPTIQRQGFNVCLGSICSDLSNIFTPLSKFPDGSYALFRVGEDHIEVASDFSSSRTIWYFFNDELFISSTSQRMIISFLGNLDLNEKACGWFLSSGTLGPGNSWDKRIKMVQPRMSLHLDRKNWKLNNNQDAVFDFIPFSSLTDSDNISHEERLRSVVENVVDNFDINPSQWTLALSGGMDSRSLLYHLQDEKLNSVTWGNSDALNHSSSDAQIAKKLAKDCNIMHSYANMDYISGSFNKLIDRFICAGEGRIDHLGGYLDALNLWGYLSGTGRGVIRGYDAFGRKPPVTSDFQVRRTNNLMLTKDINVDIPEPFNIIRENIPDYLERKSDEVLEDWRDRLWLENRTPIVTAALEDIKLAYVEVINPLLSQEIVQVIQELPIDLRTNKKVWNDIVSKMFPETPFARRDAIQNVGEILALDDVKNDICNYLIEKKESLFPEKFIVHITNNYSKNRQSSNIRKELTKFIKAYSPRIIENIIRANIKASSISYQKLALRAFIVIKTNELLLEDAQLSELL